MSVNLILFANTQHTLFAVSCLSEQMRTGKPIDEIIDTLDPDAQVPEQVVSRIRALYEESAHDRSLWLYSFCDFLNTPTPLSA